MMRIGLVKTSLKENERRIPIYPEHLHRYPKSLRKLMVFESDYGRDLGFPDDFFIEGGASIRDRADIFRECELVVLPKPMPPDLMQMSAGQVLFGWPHSVQQKRIAQIAI